MDKLNNYEPTESDIDKVLSQLPELIDRNNIRNILKQTNGDICETALILLTNNNVVPKQTSPKRLYRHNEITQWEAFFKEVEQYKKDNNITGYETKINNNDKIISNLEFKCNDDNEIINKSQ